jgi:hypothetical protein
MIVENKIARNFCWALLATFGMMPLLLFIWCFDSLPAPYPMNSFFLPLLKMSVVLIYEQVVYVT